MPTTNSHRVWDTQLTTSVALLRIQLRIAPMIPGSASAAFTSNLPSSDDKTLRMPIMGLELATLDYKQDLKFVFDPFFQTFFILSRMLTSSLTTKKQSFDQNTNSHSNSCEYRSNCNSLFSKQHSDLFS